MDTSPRMAVGLSVSSHYSQLDPAEAMAVAVARAETAAAADLDHLTIGDQHRVGPDGLYLQGVPTLARMLAHWPAHRQTGLLFLMPLWHPVLVAELIGTLATMTRSRFIVQTGIGSGRAAFAAFGASLKTRGVVTDEAISVVHRLLLGETVSSERFGIDQASIRPVPSEPVEWWIGSGRAPAALERAARFGDALYLSPSWTIDEVAEISNDYRARCDRHGTAPRVVLRRDVFVGDADDDAVAFGDRSAEEGYRGMRREALVCGGVGHCVELLAPFAELGVTDIVARTMTAPPAAALRSIELLGHVRTQLNG